ncbi:MAG: acylneuraminate cytidylyltransferase family protein [Candidatus Omnitrophica bacterium]|nr:acylneuraminate cytidylyltransferase family protein [Candidatus Omnitrophota bacterium]
MSINILLTIAARAGSKGVKGKNVRTLLGKPLIAHTILQALRWGKASKVVVSTDSPEIAKIARRYGAQVPFMRPAHLATDRAGKVPVIAHALKTCEEIYKTKFDAVVDLDATAPVRTVQDLDNCLALFAKHRPHTLFSVVPSHKNPYFNMVELDPSGRVRLCKQLKVKLKRRQDAPIVYDVNASIYFYDRDYLLGANPSVLNKRCMVYVMNEESGFDIDREIDFKFLEFLSKEKIIHL